MGVGQTLQLPAEQPTALPTEIPPAATAEPTTQPTQAPTAQPTAEPAVQETSFEYLPVVKHGSTESKRIAITVDDCFQMENLKAIAMTAYNNGGKLTLLSLIHI